MACAACSVYPFMVGLVTYFAVLGLLVIITFAVLKFLGEWRGRHPEEGESNLLMPQYHIDKIETTSYGTYNQQDPEFGNGSSSKCWELYDANICVICYDEQRNCFFVPCGHSATCFICAQRIFYEENRNCPVCRRFIGKIRKLFTSYFHN
ncbi:hypothetical protein SOVF_185290 [Spinacia oleracea]|uniref:Probable E3 ubiquitin-protein ligase LUL2 n=1 Tax=Spinacia oleracea TaxID=3562 RepID=A0A9R0IRL6_SPIOL|nr:probable E3 ubiquitin-protein ligase LUL2 [Spinacia oleracea]XP_021853923.1 probable E3 ubiquitin-protein ligase LUL2 [Spinacia oleracea]KNA05990.1 hypothetical protein SOVF_185290 [Spinacia oleracea]